MNLFRKITELFHGNTKDALPPISTQTAQELASATFSTPTTLADYDQLAASFSKRIERVGDNVYCAVGYALANVTMIAVDGGKVIIDTTESVEAAKEIKREFDKLVPGPVKTIIYTHAHPDHVLGASVFAEKDTQIIAHAEFAKEVREQFSALAKSLRTRGAKQFGDRLAPEKVKALGIGPRLRLDEGGVPPFVYPTQMFRDKLTLQIGGTRIDLHEAPGETHDQIFVHLPQHKVVVAADNVYKSFPNLYAIRGAPPRPVREWIASIDKMCALKPEYLVLGHTEPLRGAARIEETLQTYRDAISYVHDSVVRMANAGKPLEDMVRDIKLPEHLRGHPFLRELYGKVEWSIRGIYDGYMGWFDGNPTNLHRLHPKEQATRLVALLGGKEEVAKLVQNVTVSGDLQWALELSDHLLALEPGSQRYRSLKAHALEVRGEAEANPIARSYYFSCAEELRGTYSAPPPPRITRDTLREIPIETIMYSLPQRLKPDVVKDVHMKVGFEFPDSGKTFTLFIRRGVGEVSSGLEENCDLKFTSNEKDFAAFLTRAISPAKALASGRVRWNGGIARLAQFRSYFTRASER